MARRNRRVRGKNHLPRNARRGLIKTQPFLLYTVTNRFQNGESTLTFVHMQNAWRDSHRLQGTETAAADEWNVEIGRALDIVARKHTEAAGIDRNRFVQAKFSGEVPDEAVLCRHGGAPGVIRLEIFLLATISVVNPLNSR